MEVQALRYFVAVAEARSFTQAATQVHVSQPALSQRIRRLERQLGTDLFVRNRQNPAAGLRLTEAGQVLLAEATDILAAVTRAEQRVRRQATGGSRIPVLIGFASSTPRELVSTAMEIAQRVPDVDGIPVHMTWGDEHAFMREGRVDLAFIQFPVGTAPIDYVVRTMASVPRVLIAPAAHRLTRLARVTFADLASESILDPGFADVPEMHRDFWLGPAQSASDSPLIVPLEVRTVEEMCTCVAAGKGLAITSAGVADSYTRPDLAFLEVEGLEPVEVGLARLEGEHRPAVLNAFEAITTKPEALPLPR